MSPSRRNGFSVLEVMISLSILAIGIMAIVGQMVTLNSARLNDRNSMALDLLMNELQERFQGCRWEVLGTTTLPWSLQRNAPSTAATTGSDNPPLIEDSTKPTQDILTMGLVSRPTGIGGLKIYVEYYRALASRADDGTVLVKGMMDGEGNDYNGLGDLRAVWTQHTTPSDLTSPMARLAFRLATNSAPTTQVDTGAPLLIRIEVQATGMKTRVLFTGRRQ